jgi:hypothetical protein
MTTWDQESFAYAEGYDPDANRYRDLVYGRHVDVGRSRDAVLIRPERAMAQLDAESVDTDEEIPGEVEEGWAQPGVPRPDRPKVKRRFYGRVELDSVRAIRDLQSILENIVAHLQGAEAGEVTLTLEVQATAESFDDRIERTIKENATQLGFANSEFEE